jgi:hypothetical protein
MQLCGEGKSAKIFKQKIQQVTEDALCLGYSTGVPAGRKINTVPAPANFDDTKDL